MTRNKGGWHPCAAAKRREAAVPADILESARAHRYAERCENVTERLPFTAS
jgi:hypothetical protein